jgi:tetratricopeptide (TPR) repeat protein
MSDRGAQTSVEKPLKGPAKLALAGAAGGTILVFYLFALGSVLLLLALLGVELVVVLAAARFGLAGTMVRLMNQHLAPLPIFLRIFWNRKGTEFRLSLGPADAPGLFQLLTKLCQRAEVALPGTVSLEMSVNAWVRLLGYRRGAGRTILGIGYDLLAGLSEAEIEAVLAHEMMHARLVQRGLNRWLRGGVGRAARLAGGLAALVEAGRRAKQPAEMAAAFLRPADWLGRKGARLVAACSRQDEFAADLGAAQLCGAELMRSALSRIESISRVAARLPWRERVAQLQLNEGFSQWLIRELATDHAAPVLEPKAEPFNKYSTHPSMADRLAALPPATGQPASPSPPGLGLLAEPDRTAEKLMAEIQRVLAEQEQKDSKALERWSRKVHARARLQPLQALGLLAAVLGAVVGPIIWAVSGFSSGLAIFMASTIIPGILGYRLGGYRERRPLPMPDFAQLQAAWSATRDHSEAKWKELEASLRAKAGNEKKTRSRARLLLSESYGALERCDYLTAHVSAHLCLGQEKGCVEAMLGLAVAAAALGQGQQVTWAFQAMQKRTRIVGRSLAWGAGWALFLCANWGEAEAFLQSALKWRPAEPTLLALLAICQARRGKLQSAIGSARLACTPASPNAAYAKLLIDLLLDGGFLREAQEGLRKSELELKTDPELMFAMVRLSLLQRNLPAAEEWTDQLKRGSPGAQMLVRLGGVYESARRSDQAAAYYNEALAAGYYPEALLGQARMAAERQDKEQAQRHVLAALDLKRALGAGGAGPLQIFQQALGQLLMLQEPALNCQAWIATLNGGNSPAALVNRSFMIFAHGRQQAEQTLNTLLGALQPGAPPVLPASIGWRPAPREQQPDGPVRPGVQGLLG